MSALQGFRYASKTKRIAQNVLLLLQGTYRIPCSRFGTKIQMPALQNGNWVDGNRMNTKLSHVTNWLELAQRANWSVSDLASLCGVSVRTLESHFLGVFGGPPKKWMNEHRNRLVIGFLKEGLSVKEAAARVGFKHSHHLSRAFKQLWGLSPTELAFQENVQKTRFRNLV